MNDCEAAFETFWSSIKLRFSAGSTAMDNQALAHLRQVNWQAFVAGWEAARAEPWGGGKNKCSMLPTRGR